MKQAFEGICNNIERRYKETQSDASRKELEELMSVPARTVRAAVCGRNLWR